jgi:hypothetical protein
MTVTTTTIKNSYSGNGSTTAFSYTFKAFASSEVKVFVRTASTGAESLRTEGSGSTNYAVSGVGATGGGTVTFVTAPASGETVVIRRLTALQQQTDYQPADPFPASSHEDALDALTHITQELQEELDRSFKVSPTNSITTPEFVDDASTRASKLLGFSSDGNTLEATTGRVSSVTTSNVAVDGSGSSQSATVSFNSTSGALALGIPVGSTGAQGATGDVEDTLTTRGDLLKRGASASERLAIGSANTVLTTNGTDPAWSTITNAMLAGSIDLTSKVTGALPLANGGTGATSLSAANIVATNAQNTFTKAQVPSTSTAALSATSGVLDYDTYTNFIITLASGSNTLAAPTTEASQIGQCGVIIFIQPSSSSAGTLSLHGDYESAGAAGITLSTANNAYDVVPYFIKADNSVLLGAPQLAFG